MANKSVFASFVGRLLPRTDTVNKAGAPAYAYDADHKLVQLALTGTFADRFYQSAGQELAAVRDAAENADPEFLARAAIYARKTGHMKDMPAFLLAVLASRDSAAFIRAFGRVVDNGRMVRTFVQIMRSGQAGRKSLGSRPKALVADWLNTASDRALLQAYVGNSPSLSDVIRMIHPRPVNAARSAFFAWVMGKPCDVSLLPQAVQDYITFKQADPAALPDDLPDVPFQMLTHLPLTAEHWGRIAQNGGWHMLRMNLNTFLRHGAFNVPGVAEHVARILADPVEITRSRVFPYQLLAALSATNHAMPAVVRDALHDAMELAVRNVPKIDGQVAVCVDVSGSMSTPVTGYRAGASSAVRCVDVAALVAAAFLRQNRRTVVLPYDWDVRDVLLDGRDTVATNAQRLSALCGGATNCSAPLARLNACGPVPDLVIFVSDNESWVDASRSRGTEVLRQWQKLKRRNPNARMVCVDITPYGNTQAPEGADILNIGGFSDAVFDNIADFASGNQAEARLVEAVKSVEL